MSELKAIDMIVNDDYKTKVYFKSEADKVIEELKEKLLNAETDRDWKNECLAQSYKCERELNQELRHQKYKRCLAMAAYWLAVSYQCVDDKHRQRAEKRRSKWLEIAERCKWITRCARF